MAAYGKGQMLGSGINPESFKLDFGGFADAARMQAQGIAGLGQSIGSAIQNYGEMKKSQQADERAVQKSKSVAKAIGDLIPDLQPTLQNSLAILDNKELPLSQRKAEAEAISDILNLGIGQIRNASAQQIEQSKLESDAAYKAKQIEIAQRNADSRALSAIAAGNAPPPTIDMPLGDGSTKLMQWDRESRSYVPTRTSGLGDSNAINSALEMGGIPRGEGAEGLPPTGDNAPEYDSTATNILLGQGGIGFTPAKVSAGEEGTVMTQAELDDLVKRGESVESQPLGGGKYFVKTSRLNNKLSSPELKLKYLEDAATAYATGDKPKALRLATAAGIGGLFGNLTISDLDEYFGSGVAPTDSAAQGERKPLAPINPSPQR